MEHPVANKLRTIVKYLETGTLLTTLAPCRVHKAYRYTNDVLAGLVALGAPASVAIFSKALGATPAAPAGDTPAANLWASLQQLPQGLAWLSLVLILIFVVTKAYVIINNTEKKLALAESNRNQFRNFGDDLESTILEKAEPMEDLNNLLGQAIQLKKLCVTNDIYPWNPFPTDAAFDGRCKKRSDGLIKTYQHHWSAPPANPGVRSSEKPKETPPPPPLAPVQPPV